MSTMTLERPQTDEAVTQVSPMLPKPEEPTGPEPRGWALVAQLIREGSKRRPQSYRGYFERTAEPGIIRSCALGALWEELGGQPESPCPGFTASLLTTLCQQRTGVSLSQQVSMPARKIMIKDSVAGIIVRLNDHYHWSREDIANWVETLDS